MRNRSLWFRVHYSLSDDKTEKIIRTGINNLFCCLKETHFAWQCIKVICLNLHVKELEDLSSKSTKSWVLLIKATIVFIDIFWVCLVLQFVSEIKGSLKFSRLNVKLTNVWSDSQISSILWISFCKYHVRLLENILLILFYPN